MLILKNYFKIIIEMFLFVIFPFSCFFVSESEFTLKCKNKNFFKNDFGVKYFIIFHFQNNYKL